MTTRTSVKALEATNARPTTRPREVVVMEGKSLEGHQAEVLLKYPGLGIGDIDWVFVTGVKLGEVWTLLTKVQILHISSDARLHKQRALHMESRFPTHPRDSHLQTQTILLT